MSAGRLEVPRVLSVRIDDEVRGALAEMATRLGTQNLSQVVRVSIMAGHANAQGLPAALSRQAFREGVLAGAGALKAKVETIIADALQEAP